MGLAYDTSIEACIYPSWFHTVVLGLAETSQLRSLNESIRYF